MNKNAPKNLVFAYDGDYKHFSLKGGYNRNLKIRIMWKCSGFSIIYL